MQLRRFKMANVKYKKAMSRAIVVLIIVIAFIIIAFMVFGNIMRKFMGSSG
jgi:hypothetical protein